VADRESNTFCTACFSGKYLAGELSPEARAANAQAATSSETAVAEAAVATQAAEATGPTITSSGKQFTA
jgi:amidophosphoribosyltransferase